MHATSDFYVAISSWGTFVIGLTAIGGALVAAARLVIVPPLKRFIKDQMTDGNGMSLVQMAQDAKASAERVEVKLGDHIEEAERRTQAWEVWRASVDAKQRSHEEAIEMWRAIAKVAEATPPS